MRKLSDFYGSKPVLLNLVAVSGVLGLGHHIDHIIRGNHVGWPVIPEVTAFTYSLFIYPLILVGLYFEYRDRDTSVYWPLVLFPIFALVAVTHFGPWALEPPSHVIEPYSSFYIGVLAFVWLLALTVSLAFTLIRSITVFLERKQFSE